MEKLCNDSLYMSSNNGYHHSLHRGFNEKKSIIEGPQSHEFRENQLKKKPIKERVYILDRLSPKSEDFFPTKI